MCAAWQGNLPPQLAGRYKLDPAQTRSEAARRRDKIVGIWARLKQVKDDMTTKGPEPTLQHDGVPDAPVHLPHEAPGADPMQGYSVIYASELIDDKTCKNCAAHDGHDYTSMAAAVADYPDGGYKHCESESGCRGTLVLGWDGS